MDFKQSLINSSYLLQLDRYGTIHFSNQPNIKEQENIKNCLYEPDQIKFFELINKLTQSNKPAHLQIPLALASQVDHYDLEIQMDPISRTYLILGKNIESSRRLKNWLHEIQNNANVGGWEFCLTNEVLIWSDQTYRTHELPINSKILLSTAISFYNENDREKLEKAF